jgi:PadR family transcriptional regulator
LRNKLYICSVYEVTRGRKHSEQTRAVLAELASDPALDRYGYELAKATGLASGTLYPILMRLEERGLLEARWELGERRPRHVYRLTLDGVAAAAQALGSDASRTTPRPRSAVIA